VGLVWGLFQSATFRNRTKQLQGLIFALKLLETEITYGFTPLAEALDRISKCTVGEISGLLGAVASEMRKNQINVKLAWHQAVGKHGHRLDLCKQELEVIAELVSSLGVSNYQDQLRYIQLAMNQLEMLVNQAAIEQKQNEKTAIPIGIMVACMVVFLFL
jgi:stage III sporulation protein AB